MRKGCALKNKIYIFILGAFIGFLIGGLSKINPEPLTLGEEISIDQIDPTLTPCFKYLTERNKIYEK